MKWQTHTSRPEPGQNCIRFIAGPVDEPLVIQFLDGARGTLPYLPPGSPIAEEVTVTNLSALTLAYGPIYGPLISAIRRLGLMVCSAESLAEVLEAAPEEIQSNAVALGVYFEQLAEIWTSVDLKKI